MRVSGFTFLRNAVRLGYPFEASIRSLLPIVNEFVVNVGQSDDETLARVRAIGDPRIRIVEASWNEGMRDRGFVYAQQKMIAQYHCTGDWAFYLEGDEVLHERDLPTIRAALERHLPDPKVEALVFDYLHFYGTPFQLAASPAFYRRAPRVIRNTIRSFSPDALFFVVGARNRRVRYPRSALVHVPIYHYGWARPVARMREKTLQASRYWNQSTPAFDDYGAIDPALLRPYAGDHPAVMAGWLATEAEQEFHPSGTDRPSARVRRLRWTMRLERAFGVDLSRKHFRVVK
jgi:hypothetical protein